MTIEALKTARAKLLDAVEACEAAGFVPTVMDVKHASGEAVGSLAFDAVMKRLDARITSEERRAMPIAIGDDVIVRGARGSELRCVVRVGRTTVTVERFGREYTYALADGRSKTDTKGVGSVIDADDMCRIHALRETMARRPKRRVNVATTGAK